MRYLCLAALLLSAPLSTQALAEAEPRVNPVVATTVESAVALVTSCGFELGEVVGISHAPPVFFSLLPLHPVGTATTTWLTGRWLESDASYGKTTLGAYAGFMTGLGLDALAVFAFRPDIDYWPAYYGVFTVVSVTTAAGAVIGYKLSRRSSELDESRLRLDPPSLALSLKPARPGALPKIAGLRLNLLSARF